MRVWLGFFATVALSACVNAGAIRGTEDSLVNRLSVGMTPDQVGTVIGAHQFEAMSGDRICRSYAYDETINVRFAHAVFEDGRLVSASDGHRSICSLP